MSPCGIGGFSFGSGIYCNTRLAEELKQQFPQWKDHLDALVVFWQDHVPASRINYPEDERFMNGQNVYWAGWGGHAVLGFEEILAEGTDGIRRKIIHYLAKERDPEKRAFRQALLIVCDGIDAFALNYAKFALDMLIEEADENRAKELAKIAYHCTWIPKQGARSFPEALQSFWFIHLLDGNDSPGRFDQFMFPYYQRDVDSDELTKEEAQDWIDHLWKRFNDTRSWNVCVGGLRPDGCDGTNDLTFMALEATRRIKKVAPNLSLRLHKDSSINLWKKAIEVIETGVGMPALYNDDVFIPALISG
jgi:formate C-acetyltransferase